MAYTTMGFVLVCLLALLIDYSRAFHNGAPCSTQYTMTPSSIFHGAPQNPASRPPPYEFQILDSEGNVVTKYKDEVYKIKITAVDTSFRGFLLQARPATAEGYPIGHLRAGMFIRDATWKLQGIKVQPCPGVFNDSLTHATNEDRSSLEVQWKPTRNHGPILFMLTIIQNRTMFWTQWLPSTGLITPEEGAVFTTGGEFAKLAGAAAAKLASAKGKVAAVETEAATESPDEQGSTGGDVGAGSGSGSGSGDAELPEEVETTLATTKRPKKGKGKGHRHRTTTTAVPSDETDAAETTQEVPITNAGPKRPAPAVGSSSERLPPAPAAAVAPGGSGDEEGEELKPLVKPATKAPNKSKKGKVTTQPPPPGDSGDEESIPLANGKLPPAAPAGTEDSSSESSHGANRLPPAGAAIPPGAGAIPPGPDESETTDYCAEKPCINNGTCINVPDEERYDCRCPSQWAGPQCAYPNLCEKHKCKNGAECVNGETKYTCKCAREWAGEVCDKTCPSYLCENGGTCILNGGPGGEQYGCICAPGYTGPRCHEEIKHCDSNPCLNGATCVHRFNAFECRCKDGYMGETCHRPCQDIYRSCDFWGEQEKCETQRPTTKWFDINCAKTCGQCKYDNHTTNVSLSIAPVLEPFDFLLGRWTVNATDKHRFPVDFLHEGDDGYTEELIFSVTEVPQFGPPSINFTAIAVNNKDHNDVMVTVGFLTVRPATVPLRTFLMTTGNDGITVVEDGFTNNTVIQLNSTYFAILPWVDDRAPATAKRTFSIANSYLKEDVERTTNGGQKDYFTKYYWRQEKFSIY